MKTLFRQAERLLEKNLLPDAMIRFGIRYLLKEKLKIERHKAQDRGGDRISALIQQLKQSPIAVNTADANVQHYEVPTAFFTLVMGKYMKYSRGFWQDHVTDIDQSERDMLEMTVERAELVDGHDILELGCGWGSLSLYMAENFPNSTITGISNSRTQKQYIDGEARKKGVTNLTILTKDMNDFKIDRVFDRAVSVEMFEHMRNYQQLLAKIASCLKPDGKLFVHIFTHKDFAYLHEPHDEGFDWMERYFFTGGSMQDVLDILAILRGF